MGVVMSKSSWPSGFLFRNQSSASDAPNVPEVQQPKVVIQPEDCHILRLPPELRVYIYGYVLDNAATSLNLKLNRGGKSRAQIRPWRKTSTNINPLKLSLFQTCKLINAEASPMIWTRMRFTVSKLASIREVAIQDREKENVEYRESLLMRLVAIVPAEKLQLIQHLEFHYYFDLVHMLGLEDDLRKLRGLEPSEELISIAELLKGVRTIKVSTPYHTSKVRAVGGSRYHFWSQDPVRSLSQVFLNLREIFLVSGKDGVERLEVPGTV